MLVRGSHFHRAAQLFVFREREKVPGSRTWPEPFSNALRVPQREETHGGETASLAQRDFSAPSLPSGAPATDAQVHLGRMPQKPLQFGLQEQRQQSEQRQYRQEREPLDAGAAVSETVGINALNQIVACCGDDNRACGECNRR